MLKEFEKSPTLISKESIPTFKVDAVVVGSGIMGLLTAKKLSSLGQRVVLLESSDRIAAGASIKNHGWLHNGTAHAISVDDFTQAKNIVKKIIYGHEQIKSYAPECIENIHEPIYFFTQDATVANRATKIWSDLDIFFREIPREEFYESDVGIKRDSSSHFFKSADLKINNRVLFQKLLVDILEKKGAAFTNSLYEYENEHEIKVYSQDKRFNLRADIFIYCPGMQIEDAYKKLTRELLNISFWKSHLLILPRFSPYSLVALDREKPIIINHKSISIVNRAYDEVFSDFPDTKVDKNQLEQSLDSLHSLYPLTTAVIDRVEVVACSKPSLKIQDQSRQSVDSQIFEPVKNHYFVLPGKMTEAPFVADELIQLIYSNLDFGRISLRPADLFFSKGNIIQEDLRVVNK